MYVLMGGVSGKVQVFMPSGPAFTEDSRVVVTTVQSSGARTASWNRPLMSS